MSNIDLIRAWNDEEYRDTMSDADRATLQEKMSGMVELSDSDMEALTGGSKIKIKNNPVLTTVTVK
jgi:mersacidin/lichenicidin family type 2 lantibiotic